MRPALRLVPLLVCFAKAALAQDAPPETPAPAAGAAAAPAEAPPAEAPPTTDLSTQQAGMKTEKHEAPVASAPAESKPPPPAPEDHEAGEDDTFGHMMQFGIRTGIVLGYKIDFRYPHSPICRPFDPKKESNKQQKICGYGAPAAADVAISFAPLDGVEPYLFGRFGFSGESQTNTKPLRLFGLGARLYTMSDSRFKIFVEPALAWETEGWAGNQDWDKNHKGLNPEYKKDIIFHLGVGPQYDFAKAFGLFANVGIDVGVLRSISSILMGEIGFQLRFP